MPLEIEAKIKVDDLEPTRQKLTAVGATRLGRVLETNHIFDNADRSLLAGDKGLRIRWCVDESGQVAGAMLTYKGPRNPGRYKSREELEVVLDDASKGSAILAALGYAEVICFQKRRETWRLGPCLVELDELPHLGMYVEVEGPDEPAVQAAQQQLGLADAPHVPTSYVALLATHCDTHQQLDKTRIFFTTPEDETDAAAQPIEP